ncbi:hypothetical protein TNCT_153731 [Trichonephila clavata]|uniref:Uncharacterized protein n=1 Tax=Trichonephila clavata TaxID=2740835 RepID=A0A8X6JV22_TRICU|nr:hypothetical protein TNCT_153731 [Trichonephila clavata]
MQCSKNESTLIVKVTKTIDSYPREEYVFAFTDGSSDQTFEDGRAGINFTFPPNNGIKHFKVGAGKIASNYTCELLANLSLNEYIHLSEKERS